MAGASGGAATILLSTLAAFVVAVVGTGLLCRMLLARAVLDRPNSRSLHRTPVPRGGGIAVLAGVAITWTVAALTDNTGRIPALELIGIAFALAVVSFVDDVRPLPASLRLIAHLAAVSGGLVAMWDPESPVLQGMVPDWLDVAVSALAWVWFVNLFNFMDGIDGIAGVETTVLGLGVAALALVAVPAAPWAVLGAPVAAAAVGFLVWNWHPARIFMGDVGSVPLGYLLGAVLLDVARHGAWVAALVLPAYFLADATLTLALRLWRRERVWEAHRSHFYQRAVQAGLRHDQVSVQVFWLGAVLAVLAVVAEVEARAGSGWTRWAAVALAVVAVSGVLARFAAGPRREPPDA